MENKFKEFYVKDLGQNVEVLKKKYTDKKTNQEKTLSLNYISWVFALKLLKEEFPEAGYKTMFFDNLPYKVTPAGAFVGVELWLSRKDRVDGLTETYIFPVLDAHMKSVNSPNSFQINTAHQRCLSKLIAVVTGIGLSVYSGEDITSLRAEYESEEADDTPKKTEPKKETTQLKVVAPAINKFEKIEAKLKATTNFNEYMNYVTKCLSYDASLSDSKVFTDLVEKYKPVPLSAEPEPKQTNLTDYEELLNQHNKGKTEDYISFLAKMQRENPELEKDLEWEFAVQKCTPRSRKKEEVF